MFICVLLQLPQPEVKSNGQPAINISYETPETTVLPSVSAHAFQAAPSRPVISDSTKMKMAEALSKQSDYNNVWSNMNYAKSGNTEKDHKGDGSIFTALEQKSSVVNFNSCSNLSQGSSNYDTIKVNNKKRKIRIIPKSNSGDSVSSEKKGSQNTLSHVLEPSNHTESSSPEMFGSGMSSRPQENVPCGQDKFLHSAASLEAASVGDKAAVSSRRETSLTDGSALKKENKGDKKINSIAAYIKDVSK